MSAVGLHVLIAHPILCHPVHYVLLHVPQSMLYALHAFQPTVLSLHVWPLMQVARLCSKRSCQSQQARYSGLQMLGLQVEAVDKNCARLKLWLVRSQKGCLCYRQGPRMPTRYCCYLLQNIGPNSEALFSYRHPSSSVRGSAYSGR